MDQKLSELVEELTTSGEPQLNPEKMKQLKKICKSSGEQLGRAHRLLMAQLSQEHAEVRLSAFQVLDQLFARSHQFRTLVVSNFQEFLELTLGTDHERPLPPPREVAQRLRQAATQAIRGWNEKYGAAYKKLALGFHFLKHSKQVDFQDVDARTLAERKRAEERQKRLDRIYKERSEWAAREMEEMSAEIRDCLTELESCFRLLLPFDLDLVPGAAWCPVPEKGDRDEEQPCCSKSLPACARRPGAVDAGGPPSEDEDSDPDGFVRRHGLGSRQYTLDVELSSDSLRVRENEDNSAVIRAARDALRLIQNKLLPAACSWVQLFTRAGTYGGHLEGAIHLKAELEAALKRSRELDIAPEEGRSGETAAPGDEDEDEDDFVEVPEKEGYEACVPEHLQPECGTLIPIVGQRFYHLRECRCGHLPACLPTRARGHASAPAGSAALPRSQETFWSSSDSRKPGFSFPHSSHFLSWGQVTRMWTRVMPPCAESCPHVCVAASRPTSLPGAVLPRLLGSPLRLLLRLQHLFSFHLLGALFAVFRAVRRKAQERGQGPRGGVPLGPDGSAPCLPGRWPRAQLGRAGRGQGQPRHWYRRAEGPGEWGPGVSETRPLPPWALSASTWPSEVSVWRPWQ
ncbi:UV-stimulated scaffold protein A isoform X2 [Bubalus bubalis]|uniref:UV-stimulated scaffold protein A isoform X2 n=1 Tax=Bubalus bubalis TaxID=89462 RepID=UPI00042CC836|nr:UV-stimulated scaffold protein A isoform X2 [Bubalus bubalis]XP_045022262.1 UV-stimulated scaffold protein A isoform X2 [Bubalus bubalis]